MIYGNHDIVKRRKGYMNEHCNCYYCESSRRELPLLPGINVLEGVNPAQRRWHRGIVSGTRTSGRSSERYALAACQVFGTLFLEEDGTDRFLDPTGSGRPRKAKRAGGKRDSCHIRRSEAGF